MLGLFKFFKRGARVEKLLQDTIKKYFSLEADHYALKEHTASLEIRLARLERNLQDVLK